MDIGHGYKFWIGVMMVLLPFAIKKPHTSKKREREGETVCCVFRRRTCSETMLVSLRHSDDLRSFCILWSVVCAFFEFAVLSVFSSCGSPLLHRI